MSKNFWMYTVPGWVLIAVGVGLYAYQMDTGKLSGPDISTTSATVPGILIISGIILGLFWPRVLQYLKLRNQRRLEDGTNRDGLFYRMKSKLLNPGASKTREEVKGEDP